MKANLNILSKAELKAWADKQDVPVLADEPSHYFELDDPGVRMVEIQALHQGWPLAENPGSIHRAMVYAHAAAQGLIPKRKPLTVHQNPDGSYKIKDGTATYGAALRSGWHRLPVLVVQ